MTVLYLISANLIEPARGVYRVTVRYSETNEWATGVCLRRDIGRTIHKLMDEIVCYAA